MVLLDLTVVTVALPAVSRSLDVGLAGLQWVSNGYTVSFAAMLLTAGWLSDRFGGRRVFLCGLASFGVLSGISATATDLATLVALRVALGLAGALLLPASLALLTRAHDDPATRARAVGSWAAITGAALAAGPVIGGVLTETFGWRAVFLVNVPLALASLVITVRLAPRTAPAPRGSLDLPGQASGVLALAGLIYVLVEGPQRGWVDGEVIGAFGCAVLAAVLFGSVEARAAGAAMLPLHLFRSRGFCAALSAGLLATFTLSGLLFVLSLYFQDARGYSALGSGLAFLPLTVPTAVNPMFTGRLVARMGPRRPATLGFVQMAVGVALLAPSTGGSVAAVTTTAAGLLVLGVGISFALPALVAAVVGSVPTELTGTGMGALNSARQVGGALGVAILGILLRQGATTAAGTRLALVASGGILLVGAIVCATSLPGRARRPAPATAGD
ncbi:MFS transporter [Frankia sp. AiPa1]|uniref:MFS transporter n=1 Tax=Frankia sp. AiPa1 TaxID=573492 RepID=UPI00202B3D58|nr:MFS transporter [Frankia sp. AiPa1]